MDQKPKPKNMNILGLEVDDQVMYKNILGEWHQGVVIKTNNTTVRILNTKEFKILSLKYESVLPLEEYEAKKDA